MIGNHFTVVVIGENHAELMKQYDNKLSEEPRVIYEFSKVKEYKDTYIKSYEGLLTMDVSDIIKGEAREKIDEIKNQDDVDFYLLLTEGFEIDQETGNALGNYNVNGKYDVARIGKNFALPLIDKNGNETYSELKKNIDFSKIHKYNTLPYQVAWETVVEGRKPNGNDEKNIYENMKNRIDYFMNFGTKENYISWSTSFWGYAFVDKNGWQEFNSGTIDDQIKWVNSFYDKFIKPLKSNERITIYECIRN